MLYPIGATDPVKLFYRSRASLAHLFLRLYSLSLPRAKARLDLYFLMVSMAAATWAKFSDRELFGLALLVFAGRVVAPLATIALKAD